ncbi:MAG: ABC transporter permease [Chloroflexi bacterium]|nr:ABC transporter permease [Chloroflexota bacterium]
MMQFLNLKIERKEEKSLLLEIAALVLALAGSVLVAGILIKIAGADPIEGFRNLVIGGFGGKRQILETLLRSAPLLLTGLATVIAFRGKIWSIGQEGQLFAGAMLSYWLASQFSDLPRLPLLILVVLGGFIGGALLGWISGVMKAYFQVDIIISTVLLNYIINNVILLLLYEKKYWMDAASFYPRTAPVPDLAWYPILVEGHRVHIGVVIALVAAVLIYWILKKTPLGYDIRALGENPIAAKARGINVNRILIITMIISGGLAGLAGAGEVFGVLHKLQMDISPGYGYTGIIVGMLAELHPLVTIITAIFFGGLINGSVKLVTAIGIPTALIYAIQAIILIFILAARVITRYRIRRVSNAG